jgi:hypothetical protein
LPGIPLDTRFPANQPEKLADTLKSEQHGDHVLIAQRRLGSLLQNTCRMFSQCEQWEAYLEERTFHRRTFHSKLGAMRMGDPSRNGEPTPHPAYVFRSRRSAW